MIYNLATGAYKSKLQPTTKVRWAQKETSHHLGVFQSVVEVQKKKRGRLAKEIIDFDDDGWLATDRAEEPTPYGLGLPALDAIDAAAARSLALVHLVMMPI